MKKLIFTKVKESMEKLIWQVEVKVRNKQTKFDYGLSTWLVDKNAELSLDAL